MVRPERCAVVLPCFNEGATIAGLVTEVRQYVPTVIVVDDGSTDSSATGAREAGATVISHASNRGKGAALKTGLTVALKGGWGWALTMDADGQHKPQDLPAFFQCAERTDALLVIGNRMHNPQAIPWLDEPPHLGTRRTVPAGFPMRLSVGQPEGLGRASARDRAL